MDSRYAASDIFVQDLPFLGLHLYIAAAGEAMAL